MLSRSVYSVNYKAMMHSADYRSGRCEMDSHADTCVAGSICVVLEHTGRKADVEAYSLARLPLETNPNRNGGNGIRLSYYWCNVYINYK